MTSIGATALSTFIGTLVGFGFHQYFPILTEDKKQFITSFVIGAFMAIGFERQRRAVRALISGFIFMLLTKPDSAYVLFWGPPIILPFVTFISLKGCENIDQGNVSFKKYLLLSFLCVIIFYFSMVLYLNAALILEGNGIIPSPR